MVLVLAGALSGCMTPLRRMPVSAVYPGSGESDLLQQPWPPQSGFFDPGRILEIRIRIDPQTMQEVVEPRLQVHREQVYALAEEIRIGDLVISNVGIRARGQTSWHKLNFKLSFDTEELYLDREVQLSQPSNRQRRVWGVAKLNLRASANDPTLLREQMAAFIFRQAGALSSRMGFARLYINGKYWGLYNTVEQIDKEFIQERFQGKTGHLYKGGFPAKFKPSSYNMFVAKTKKKDPEKQTPVKEFFQFLKTNQEPRLLAQVVDVDSALNYLAAASLVGHWDSFLYNPNNDYLYRHSDGKWYIIAWDLDNTYGSGIGWGFPVLSSSIYCMKDNDNYTALFTPLLSVPEWRELYRAKLQWLLNQGFHPAVFKEQVEKYKTLIGQAVLEDSRKKGDWQGIRSLKESNQVWEEAFTRTPELWRAKGFNGYDKGLLGWQADRWQAVRKELK